MKISNNNVLLVEGARDRALEMFIPYFQKRGINISISQLKQALLAKFVNEAGMHSLSLDSNFYLCGVAKYYFSGNLTSNKQLNLLYPRVKDRFIPEICQRLDALVEILRNSYVDSVGTNWEQPEDFGSLTIQQLFRKYNSKINKALGITNNTKEIETVEEPKVNDDYTAGRNYTYEILYGYEDAKKYNKATEPGAWCITYGKQHYDGYIKRLKIHYIVFRQNGYENMPRQKGNGYPQDVYGNSLICVLQSNTSPKPIYITSRWNHGGYDTPRCEADHAYTTEQFLNIIGCDSSVLERAFEQWKANVGNEVNKGKDRAAMRADRINAMRQLKYAQMLINGGTNPFEIQYLTIQPIFSDERNYLPGATADYHPYNPKGLFWVKVYVNDSEAFVTFMDRKQIMFDKYLVSTETMGTTVWSYFINNHNDNYISFAKLKSFMIYDRKRRQFLNLDGVMEFPHGTSQFTSHYNTDGYKYGLVALSGNQLALINIETMKPVRTRNGSCWFESILAGDARAESNRDYRGHISFPNLSIQGNLLHMIYDSASGEDYWFNTRTDSFINTRSNLPEGFIAEGQWYYDRHYMKYTKGKGNRNNFGTPRTPIMLKNIDTDEVLSVAGKEVFLDIEKHLDVIGFRPIDSEYAYYWDTNLNRLITLNGQPVSTKYRAALQNDTTSEYYEISLSRWRMGHDGEVEYSDFYKNIMLYNPYSGQLYCNPKISIDDSGYVFHWYGSGYVIPPGAKDFMGASGRDAAIRNGDLVAIPKAKEAAYQTERTMMIGRILREEIDKLLKNIKELE